MSLTLRKSVLEFEGCRFNAMALIPDSENLKPQWGVFTHGYTSNKNDVLNWAQRLTEAGMPTIIFDLPGHYLGSYEEVDSFEHFIEMGPKLFSVALEQLRLEMKVANAPKEILIGGHSLGALFSLQALKSSELSSFDKRYVGVGIGINNNMSKHLFETSFYRNTLTIRKQLVSPAIGPDLVFPWVRDQKNKLQLSGEKMHFITGEDDAVVGPGGLQCIVETFQQMGNEVTFLEPKKLQHHMPGLAATYIYSYAKEAYGW